MSLFRFYIPLVVVCFIAINCSTESDEKYNRIVNKSWIQDSSHSFLTAYSFEFEDYVGKTLGRFLTDYPDSVYLQHFMEEPTCTLTGWLFRFGSDEFQVKVTFDYDSHSDVIRRDTLSRAEWILEDYLDQRVLRFEVRDIINRNRIFPRKYDKLNREIED